MLAAAPVDVEGRLVPAAGALSIVVLDAAISGESARVARWDVAAEQVARSFVPRGTGSTAGIELGGHRQREGGLPASLGRLGGGHERGEIHPGVEAEPAVAGSRLPLTQELSQQGLGYLTRLPPRR